MNAAQRPAMLTSNAPQRPTFKKGSLQHTASTHRTSTHRTSTHKTSIHRTSTHRTAVGTPSKSLSSQSHQRAYQPKRVPYAGARRAIALESSVKLTVNLLLAIVATTTIAKLVPYYQSQQARLNTLQTSVVDAEERNAELRSQFDRNFDPAQATRIMQEQSGMAYPNQKQIIWTEPVDNQ